jgi:hypothetical protein
MYGLPLHVYNKKTILLPLFTLNDIEILRDYNGFTLGTTNALMLQLQQIKADVYINIDTNSFVLGNKKLEDATKITGYEQQLAKKLFKVIFCES